MDDGETVAAQLDRPPRAPVDVLSRCHLGLPVLIDVPPFLDDGTPFPTSSWLTCPLAVKRIARIEADGGVRAAERMIEDDAVVAGAYAAAMERYRLDRDARVPVGHAGPAPTGGVGGSTGGVKCLHAHYADHAAGHDNPVGAWVARDIEPLNCPAPCVTTSNEGIRRNPGWVEPPLP